MIIRGSGNHYLNQKSNLSFKLIILLLTTPFFELVSRIKLICMNKFKPIKSSILNG